MPKFAPALSIPGLTVHHQGKTRDTWKIGTDLRLIVATDRLSTHNVVHTSTVPRKGEVLTALTLFWIKHILEPNNISNHLIASGMDIYDYLPGERGDYPPDLHHRAILVDDLDMIPVEFIFRAYLTGSLYHEYYSKGKPDPYGINLPPGLKLMTEFAEPIFTPTDKSETDEPLNSQETIKRYPGAYETARETYNLIRAHLRRRGLEACDTKLEIGIDPFGMPCVGDEILTPDSSRFCTHSEIRQGQEPAWRDKQIARDEAMKMWAGGPKCPLEFRPEIIATLTDTYLQIFGEITGTPLENFEFEV